VASHSNRSVHQANSSAAARPDAQAPRLAEVTKRMFDIIAAITSLVLLAPILMIIAIAIRLESRGPIFVRQTLYGHNNRPIEIRKFRTVRAEGTQIKPRLTWIGQILRRTGIDELPQLFNVLSGDMSVIGPPPCDHPSALLNKYKPGVTDWAQIIGSQNGTPS
jgi:putative colanic acid biosysnthesis UDP-glucose lipid carrier transferase